jgi:SAM-dependent methyltransferase
MTTVDPQSRVLALRMWRSLLATQELLAVYLGVRLGWYETLAGRAGTTPKELAGLTATDPRYAREWLEQQAVAGIVAVDDPARDEDERIYTVPEAHAKVLLVSDDPLSMSALAVLPLGGVAAALPDLLAAYRTGAGVPDSVYGADWREGHSGANRALFAHQLADWIRRCVPDVHALLGTPGRRIADVGCGAGWSSIALARGYPAARVDGFDLDADAVADARGHALEAGVADRVRVEVGDARELGAAGRYDLVCLFDVLHELPYPVQVLRACRELRSPTGTVLVLDARVAPAFEAPGDEVERFQYGTSVLHCLPASRTSAAGPVNTRPDSAGGPDGSAAEEGGTGTVLRPDAVRRLALRAGFGAVTVLPVEDRFHRLYRLIG